METEDSMDIKDEDIDLYLENEQRAMLGTKKSGRHCENPLVPYKTQ